MNRMKKTLLIFAALLLAASLGFALEHAEPSKVEPAKASEAKTEQTPDEHKAAGLEAAAGDHGEAKEAEDQHTQLTQSKVVKLIAAKLHVSPKTAYWLFAIINLVILGYALRGVAKSGIPGLFPPIPQVFRDRHSAIQKGMEEARKASAESAARLAEIEGRLSKLDSEIANMRSQAESEARAEEERLRAATEDEKRKIVQSAEQEIGAAANSARRELKNLAAELAVSLAEKNIKVSDDTDKVLVRDFASHLDTKGRS